MEFALLWSVFYVLGEWAAPGQHKTNFTVAENVYIAAGTWLVGLLLAVRNHRPTSLDNDDGQLLVESGPNDTTSANERTDE